ncbi:MAG TPA: hypothetical protein DEV93_18810, partial [Chloroflexi bacterium]|nr:hypothetical protein [Chloroflexota bacterium]
MERPSALSLNGFGGGRVSGCTLSVVRSAVRSDGTARAGGRGLLGLVPIEDALGAVELAGHVVGVVVDLPGRAPQRVVGD